MCQEHSEERQKHQRKVCFFFLRGWCKYGRRCRFSHRRPSCRYGEECRYRNGPTGCRYFHEQPPRVGSVTGGITKGRHNARNKRWRHKNKALKSEAKASLEKVKELEVQLQLEQKKNEELQEELKVQLELMEKKIGELHSEKNSTAWYQLKLYRWLAHHVRNHGTPYPSFPLFHAGLAFEIEKRGVDNCDGFLQAEDQNKAARYRSMYSEVLRRVHAAMDAGAKPVANES
ncbi:unnamed protein product [Heterosigma akashiwo]